MPDLAFQKKYYVDMTAKYSADAAKKFLCEAVSSGKSKTVSICKGNR